MNVERDPLSGLLREWRGGPSADPFLTTRVSADIAKPVSAPAPGATRRSRALALVCIALGVFSGAAAAEWLAQKSTARAMPQRYLTWIDPKTELLTREP